MIKLFVVANNIKQAEQYANKTIFSKDEWVYVWDKSYLYGRRHFVPHVRVGQWYEHPDIYNIERQLKLINSPLIGESK